MNLLLWSTLKQAMTGLPCVAIGPYFFNLLAIEQAYYFPPLKSWLVILTNNAQMMLDEQDEQAQRLIDSFQDAPFALHNTLKRIPHNDEVISSIGYFNVGAALIFEQGEVLTVHLTSGARVEIQDQEGFKRHIDSALSRARLSMPPSSPPGGKRR